MCKSFYCFTAKYWHGLYIDYKDVAVDVVKDCTERPIHATVYITRAYCFLSVSADYFTFKM